MFFGDKLKISDNKTGFIIMMDMKQQLSRVHVDSLKAREVCVPSVKSVKNLGTWIDGNSRQERPVCSRWLIGHCLVAEKKFDVAAGWRTRLGVVEKWLIFVP